MRQVLAYGTGGDALPAEEPQALSDRAESKPGGHDWSDSSTSGVEDYNFVFANGQFHVSEDHPHEDLIGHAGVPDPSQHKGPMAVGHIHVDMGKASFDFTANISAQAVARILKDYAKEQGWAWGGMTDETGQPIGAGSEFAPIKSFYYQLNQHKNTVKIANKASLIDNIDGVVHILDGSGFVHGPTSEGLREWASDQGIGLRSYVLRQREATPDNGHYGANDNVMRKIEDLEENNIYSPEWNDVDDHFLFQDPKDEQRPGSGPWKCPECSKEFGDWGEYLNHRSAENPTDDHNDDEPWMDMDMDATFPPHFNQRGIPNGQNYTEASFHESAGAPQGKDMLPAPLPFIYDIDQDTITIGQPGSQVKDIPGKFDPSGIVEGIYEPGGKMTIITQTNMPYTTRHLIQLWYYTQPHMEVTSVQMQMPDGKNQKLASQDIGGYIQSMTAADPAAFKAQQALRGAGGKVYVVGGAVRDALLGKEPKDIDLMVSGLPAEKVNDILRELPGKMDLTGKDFGVFRYNTGGHEVEIALPRRERSTGAGHQDFNVQADHTMSAEEDLYRRDFTANAMAVDLDNGHVVDPFNGSEDLKKGVLRTLNTKSLADDPLRTVRALVAGSKHGLWPDEDTRTQMEENANGIQHLPAERVQAELDKLFAGKNPAAALKLAHETGVLRHIFPEIDRAFGHTQNNPHHELELGDHLLNVGARARDRKPDDPDFALSGFLHDIGKVDSHWTECRSCGHAVSGHAGICPNCGSDDTSGHFYEKHLENGDTIGANHETVGADQAYQALMRLKYPKARAERVRDLVANHMFPAFDTEKGARRFMRNVGPHANDLLDLRWADQGGKSEYPTDPSLSVDRQRELIDQAREQKAPTGLSQLAINGYDLIQNGHAPGPEMGSTLNGLVDHVVDHPEDNNRETLLNMANGWDDIHQSSVISNSIYEDGHATVKPGDLGPGIPHTEYTGPKIDALKQLITETGEVSPIEIAHDGFIVDGEHRYKALMDLGVPEIPVWVGKQLGASGRLVNRYPGIRIPVSIPFEDQNAYR